MHNSVARPAKTERWVYWGGGGIPAPVHICCIERDPEGRLSLQYPVNSPVTSLHCFRS
jgi:hypothetical protein